MLKTKCSICASAQAAQLLHARTTQRPQAIQRVAAAVCISRSLGQVLYDFCEQKLFHHDQARFHYIWATDQLINTRKQFFPMCTPCAVFFQHFPKCPRFEVCDAFEGCDRMKDQPNAHPNIFVRNLSKLLAIYLFVIFFFGWHQIESCQSNPYIGPSAQCKSKFKEQSDIASHTQALCKNIRF